MIDSRLLLILLSTVAISGVFFATLREVTRGNTRAAYLRFGTSIMSYALIALIISGVWVPRSGIIGIALALLFAAITATEYLIVRWQKMALQAYRPIVGTGVPGNGEVPPGAGDSRSGRAK